MLTSLCHLLCSTDDLAELEVLTDDILCECLMERYQHDKIYVSFRPVVAAPASP